MAVAQKRVNFVESEEGKYVKKKLLDMTNDDSFNTSSSFSSNFTDYPDNLIPFVDKHMNYLNTHPKVDARTYLANVRLMTRVKSPELQS
jgi:hypothetical protein